jgi:hypothetical protein
MYISHIKSIIDGLIDYSRNLKISNLGSLFLFLSCIFLFSIFKSQSANS